MVINKKKTIVKKAEYDLYPAFFPFFNFLAPNVN